MVSHNAGLHVCEGKERSCLESRGVGGLLGLASIRGRLAHGVLSKGREGLLGLIRLGCVSDGLNR